MKRRTAKTDPVISGPVFMRDLSKFFNVDSDYFIWRASQLGFKRCKDLEPLTKATATLLLEKTGISQDRIASFIAQRDFSQTLPPGEKDWVYSLIRIFGNEHEEVPPGKVYLGTGSFWLSAFDYRPDRPTFHWPNDGLRRATLRQERVAFYKDKIAQNQEKPFLARAIEARAYENAYREKADEAFKQDDQLASYLWREQFYESERKAKEYEEDARLETDYPRLLALWESLPAWNEDQDAEVFHKVCPNTLHWRQLLAHNPKWRDWYFSSFKGSIDQLFDVLEALMIQGSRSAAEAYIGATMVATRRLNDLTRRKPRFMQTLFKEFAAWPVLESPHKRFRCYPGVNLSQLRGGLNLGLYERAQWDPRDPATRVAIQLLQYVEGLRLSLKRYLKEEHYKIRDVEPALSQKVLRLKEFSPQTAAAWWDVALEYFSEAYPNPCSLDQLRGLVFGSRRRTRHSRSKSATLSLAGRNAKLMENIRGKFISLAGRRAELRRNRQSATEIAAAVRSEDVDAWAATKVEEVRNKLRGSW